MRVYILKNKTHEAYIADYGNGEKVINADMQLAFRFVSRFAAASVAEDLCDEWIVVPCEHHKGVIVKLPLY